MSKTGPVGVGFIGTGMISNTYLENLTRFPDIDVIILGDLNVDLAKARAEQHGIRQWGTADDVLNQSGRGGGGEPDDPRGARRGRVEGNRRRQERVDREADQCGPGQRSRSTPAGRESGSTGRGGPGHGPRPRGADRAAGHRPR